jgi:hypothetical protein
MMTNPLPNSVLVYMKSQLLPLGFQITDGKRNTYYARVYNQQSGETILESEINNPSLQMSQSEAHEWVVRLKHEIDEQFGAKRMNG